MKSSLSQKLFCKQGLLRISGLFILMQKNFLSPNQENLITKAKKYRAKLWVTLNLVDLAFN